MLRTRVSELRRVANSLRDDKLGKEGKVKRFTIDFEAWTTVEAKDEDEAFEIAQSLVAEIEEFVRNNSPLPEPLEMLVRDDGVSEEE